MSLEFGMNDAGELIRVDQVGRGRVAVKCPYCEIPLLARKGEILAAHFAHDGPTCLASLDEAVFSLPVYDNFNLHLSGALLDILLRWPNTTIAENRELVENDLLKLRSHSFKQEITSTGQIPRGELSFYQFIDFQEPLFLEKHNRLAQQLEQAMGTPEEHFRLVDLRLYRAQWQRLLQHSLYFLEIQHAAGTLYKIGVTRRTIAARVAEVQADLQPHLGAVTIKVLDTWPHRGNVELYFKHRYRTHQAPMGSLTEYFTFPDVKQVLSYDLRRMPKKKLNDLEKDILKSS